MGTKVSSRESMTDKTGEFIRVEPVLRTPDERKETERRAHSTWRGIGCRNDGLHPHPDQSGVRRTDNLIAKIRMTSSRTFSLDETLNYPFGERIL